MQPVGMFASAKAVIEYGSIDFSALDITVTASSKSGATDKLMEQLSQAFVEEILPQLFIYLLWGVVLNAALVISAVYFIMLFKARVKNLAVVAMVLTIVKFVMGPVNIFALLLNDASVEAQSAWDVCFIILFIVPAILVCVQGIVNMRHKDEPAPVAAAPVESVPVAEELPVAEETPVTYDAPAEEAPEAENAE